MELTLGKQGLQQLPVGDDFAARKPTLSSWLLPAGIVMHRDGTRSAAHCLHTGCRAASADTREALRRKE
jgi:hypothetical protein